MCMQSIPGLPFRIIEGLGMRLGLSMRLNSPYRPKSVEALKEAVAFWKADVKWTKQWAITI